jgi:hypothetical protein
LSVTRTGLCATLAFAALLGSVLPAWATFPGPNGQIAYDQNGYTGIHRIDPSGQLGFAVASPPNARSAAWSPDYRTIAYSAEVGGNTDIYTVRFDGTDTRRITTDLAADSEPAWSPDGARIAFTRSDSTLYVVNGTGTLESPLHGGLAGRSPNWAPDGQTIAYVTPANRIATVDAQTGAIVQVTGLHGDGCCDLAPNWSPDGQRIAFASSRPEAPGIYTVDPDGTGLRRIRSSGSAPAWSPDGTMLTYHEGACGGPRCSFELGRMNADGSGSTSITGASNPVSNPDWGSFRPQDIGYPRPQGATPLRASLVPAYDECTDPNRTHGPPLDSPSCAPPVQSSTPPNPEASGLTVGTPDANGRPARSVGHLRLSSVPGDIRITANVTDVRCRVAFFACPAGPQSDYAAELQGWLRDVRVTDHEGAPSTITGFAPLFFAIPCAATPSSDAGGTCAVATTVNAIVPGAIVAGQRAIWELRALEVFDGGGDGEADTDDNEPFMTQGVFVP